mmetsp:Transcript_25167/g.29256  ORF Transcript_25167/g.29256 Transcript_25167/m.29256 type:complete len:167 (+) Transcript_25167:29-529(+)
MGGKSSKTTVQLAKHVEIPQFMGLWYVISRIGTPFEKGHCNSTEEYTLRPDGKIDVMYRATKKEVDGKPLSVSQTLWSVSPDNAHMKVRIFWPFTFDYLVLDVDPEYKWTIVGTSMSQVLWIMAREPHMNSNLYKDLVERCRDKGYDVKKLEVVKHAPNAQNLHSH